MRICLLEESDVYFYGNLFDSQNTVNVYNETQV